LALGLKNKENNWIRPYLIIGGGSLDNTRLLEWTIYCQNRPLDWLWNVRA